MNVRVTKWTLVDREPVPCEDFEAWTVWMMRDANRRVGWTEVDGVEISTVFLGVGLTFGDAPPRLFETCVFTDAGSDQTDRYVSWDEAVAGHAAVVARIRDQG
jgi:hypothetical protein